jgi:hypothetical protein
MNFIVNSVFDLNYKTQSSKDMPVCAGFFLTPMECVTYYFELKIRRKLPPSPDHRLVAEGKKNS